MKRLSLSVLLASTLLITACGSDDSHDADSAVGTSSQVDAVTHEYHEKMEASTPAVTPMNPEGVVIGSPEDIAEKTKAYHEQMEALAAEHHAPVVGSPEDIAEKTKAYHEQMEALSH